MRALVLRILNLLLLLISVAWFTTNTTWGPGITAFGLFITFLSQDIYLSLKNRNKKDIELCEFFLKEFPSNSRMVDFLKNHDVAVSFQESILSDIDCFVNYWDNAEYAFINKKLNKLLCEFRTYMDTYRRKLAPNIHTLGDTTTKFYYDDPYDSERIKLNEKLNDMGTMAYKKHQDLSKAIRVFLNK